MNYDQLEKISNGIERGNIKITRLNEEAERGRIEGGRRNVEASVIAGTEARASSKTRQASRFIGWDDHKQNVKSTEKLLEQYAKDNKIWFDYDSFGRDYGFFAEGMEAQVFDDGDYVIKAVGYDFAERQPPVDFLDRIAIHNTLFPDTKYELIGFTKDNNGYFRFVLKQPFIHDTGKISRTELKKHLKTNYDLVPAYDGRDSFTNQDYLVRDLHPANIIKSESGIIHFIDPIVSVNPNTVVVPPFNLKKVRIGCYLPGSNCP